MMLSFKLKQIRSGFLLSFFVLLILSGALISEFFQAPVMGLEHLKVKNPLRKKDLASLKSLVLTNKFGTFILEQSETKVVDGQLIDYNGWSMTSPRPLPVSKETIDRILNALSNIKIRKLFPNDPINVSNFLIDRPMLTIELKYKSGESNLFSLGMVNAVDNSAYVSFGEKDLIYQIDAMNEPLETMNFTDLVDSKIFSMASNSIQSLEIFRGRENDGQRQLVLKKDGSLWKDSSGKPLSEEKVAQFLEQLTSVRSQFILDKQSTEMKSDIDKYLARPFYTVVIKDQNSQSTSYHVSNVVNSLPDLKVDKRNQLILMRASNREHPYIVNKSYLNSLQTREKELRGPSINKIFY